MKVRDFAAEPLAKKCRGLMQVHATDGHPEIELVTLRSTPKTAVRVFVQIGREAAAVSRG